MGNLTKIYDNALVELLQGEINERLPMVTQGLVAYFPFDGETAGVWASDSSKMLPSTEQSVNNSFREGLGVGPTTTNLVSAMNIQWNPWSGLTGTYESYTNIHGRNGIHITVTNNTGGVNYYSSGSISVSPSTTYCISILLKYSVEFPSPNLIYVREYAVGGGQNSEGGYYSNNNQTYSEMGWYRAWAKFTTSSNASYITIQGYEYNVNEIWVEDLQMEQSVKHTPYLVGSRNTPSYVTFPSLPSLGSYTVVGQFVPLSPFDNTYDITPNQSILFTLKDTSTAGDAQYRYYVSGVTSMPFIETTGSFGNLNYHAAYTVSAFVPLWYVIRKSGTAFSCDIYQNGFKGTHSFTLPVNNQLNSIELGGNESTVWPGYHRNLSLYNRSLSDSEVQQMIAGRQVLRPDGSLGCLLNENVNPNLWPNADFQSLTYGVQGNGEVTLKTDSYGTYHEMVISDTAFTYHGYDISTNSGSTYVFSGWFWVSAGNTFNSSAVAIEGAASGGGYPLISSVPVETWTYCKNTCVADDNVRFLIYPTGGSTGSGTIKWRNVCVRKLPSNRVQIGANSELTVGEFQE